MKKYLVAGGAIASLLAATAAQAATDGTLANPSSTGTAQIQAVVQPMVRVSNLHDITINATADAILHSFDASSTAIDGNTTFCVYSNNGNQGDYTMAVSTGHGSFALPGPGTTPLPYSVWASDSTTNVFTGTFLGAPGTRTGLHTASGGTRTNTTNCADVGGADANLHVRFLKTDLLAANAGTYQDTLTVTVSVP